MQGRYGTDKLNNCLFVLFLVLWFVNIFVFAPIPTLIIDAFEIAIIVITVFRSLSRNISKRSVLKMVEKLGANVNRCQKVS